MKYFIYLRKSSENEDRQALSIESQKEEALKLTAQHNIADYEILSEEKSASKLGRPVFGEMIKKISEEKSCGIICWKLDRLARNPVEGGAILWALQQGKIEKIITPFSVFTKETNVIVLHIEFGMAHQYVRDLSANTKRGLERKLALGQYPGQAPIGYRNVGIDKGFRTIETDQPASIFVKKVIRLMALGSHSLKSLALKLNDEYTSLAETSLKWKAYKERKGKRRTIRVFEKLHPSKIERIIRNPLYYGYFGYVGKLYRGTHEPIVTKQLWDRANQMLNTPYQNKVNSGKRVFLYRGKNLMKCGECGCSITAEFHKKPSGKEFVHYRCTKSRIKCGQPFLIEKEVENQLAEIFASFQLTENEAEKIYKSMEQLKQEDISYSQQLQTNLKIRLAKLENDKTAIYRKLGTLDFLEEDRTEYEKVKNQIISEISKVRHQIHQLDEEVPYWSVKASNLINLAIEAKKLFLMANREQKQKMLNLITSNLILRDKKIGFEYKKPALVLVQRSNFNNLGA